MSYTYKSLTLLWLVTSGLFALTASGLVADLWLLPVLAVAFAAPFLILRSPAVATVQIGTRDVPAARIQ